MTQNENRQGVRHDDLSDAVDDFASLSSEVPASAGEKLMRVSDEISAELRRSRRRFFFVYVFFSLAGYVASLSLCSQNAFMLRVFPIDFAVYLHTLPDPWCPVTCGLFFSALPILFLVLFLDRFQLRRVARELWWLPIATVLLACLIMTILPETLQHEGMSHVQGHLRDTRGDVVWMLWWTLAAIINPVFFILCDRILVRLKSVQ
jgi:hypothetical protein